ncbi:hypothetical protein GCM10027161_12360 [Microbispora hainanensis]
MSQTPNPPWWASHSQAATSTSSAAGGSPGGNPHEDRGLRSPVARAEHPGQPCGTDLGRERAGPARRTASGRHTARDPGRDPVHGGALAQGAFGEVGEEGREVPRGRAHAQGEGADGGHGRAAGPGDAVGLGQPCGEHRQRGVLQLPQDVGDQARGGQGRGGQGRARDVGDQRGRVVGQGVERQRDGVRVVVQARVPSRVCVRVRSHVRTRVLSCVQVHDTARG